MASNTEKITQFGSEPAPSLEKTLELILAQVSETSSSVRFKYGEEVMVVINPTIEIPEGYSLITSYNFRNIEWRVIIKNERTGN